MHICMYRNVCTRVPTKNIKTKFSDKYDIFQFQNIQHLKQSYLTLPDFLAK